MWIIMVQNGWGPHDKVGSIGERNTQQATRFFGVGSIDELREQGDGLGNIYHNHIEFIGGMHYEHAQAQPRPHVTSNCNHC